MVHNNLENKIREKLQSREIKPSEMAWDRLDAMLTVAEEKKNKKASIFSFKTIGIAASIVLFFSLGLFFVTHNKNESPKNEIVVNENKEVKKDSTIKIQNNLIQKITNPNSQVATTINNQQSAINNQHSTSFNTINQKTNSSNYQKSIIDKQKPIEYLVGETIATKDIPKIISSEKLEKSTHIKVDASQLLSSVDAKTKIQPITKVKVDANNLLSQVDGELEQSFRQKVFSRISKNYQEVKVALANRNQE